MSMIKQFLGAIIAVTVLSLTGVLVLSSLASRQYLEQELSLKNRDNAQSLALSLSQMQKDPVTVELLISAQFDTGHYRTIRLVDPHAAVLIERNQTEMAGNTPAWFTRLVPLSPQPGIAQVQDGWSQFGTLTVQTDSRFAYASMWQGSKRMLLWVIGLGLASAVIGTLVIRRLIRPLRAMVGQAQAIGELRFGTIEEPDTPEFRAVVKAMNTLSNRMHQMLSEESARVEQLRRQAQLDELTGLFNRAQFLRQLDTALEQQDVAAEGALAIVRLSGLADLNRVHGRAATDALLRKLGEQLALLTAARHNWEAGRLNASDFAILAPAGIDASQIISDLEPALVGAAAAELPPLAVGIAEFAAGDTRSALLARVDRALAASEEVGDAHHCRFSVVEPQPSALDGRPEDWRRMINTALDTHGIALASFPVVDRCGRLLHHEAPVRLHSGAAVQDAARFLPCAARLGMMSAIDLRVIELALRRLMDEPQARLAVNLSADSLRDSATRSRVHALIATQPEAAHRLWLEVNEASALSHQVEFRALCLTLRPLGCRIGLEHAGQRFSRLAELHDLGLDYIKISAAFVRDIDQTPGNEAFLRSLCTVAHSIGLLAIAEGVVSSPETECLFALGMDGVTGPGVRLAPEAA